MDFFARQKDARRKTYLLVPLFAIVVLAVTWAINRLVVLLVLLPLALVQKTPDPFFSLDAYDIWLRFHPRTTVCALVLIAAGVLWSAWKLRKGGTAVAELLGGRPIQPTTAASEERRLLNIVEEMALASGISAPAAYVLDDEGAINAFAAGNPEDGVVAVTRGALEKLDRDETQAVVAHEFSHLLNGDSHLNLRLLGLLSGLMAVSAAGTFLKQAAVTSPTSTPRRSSRRNSPLGNLLATLALLLAGWLLTFIGFLGVLFGRLIRAAVSRQREFLADAAAVQFTRNPAALVSALRKIAAQPPQWVLENEHSEEVSHLLFVPGLREKGRRLFETHPPLDDRIRAIDPHLDRTRLAAPVRTPEAVVASVGELDRARLDFARQLHGRIPEEVRQLARRPEAAPGVIYSVLMAQEDETTEAQARVLAGPGAPGASAKEILFSVSDPVLMPALLQTLPVVQKDRETLRLALVELALPALRALPPETRPGVLDTMRRLIDADRKRTLFEYAVYTLVAASLGDRHAANSRVQYERLDPVRPAAEMVLWVLARSGNRGPDEARAAWAAGLQRLGISPSDPPSADGNEVPAELPQCLAQLRGLAPQLKKRLLGGLAGCALADGQITFGEAEVLRAVSAAVGCPLPPLVAPR
jgi:Zn-dependent protease with chaperone function